MRRRVIIDVRELARDARTRKTPFVEPPILRPFGATLLERMGGPSPKEAPKRREVFGKQVGQVATSG